MTEVYLVGGAVRDELLGLRSKDLDFTVVDQSYPAMLTWLTDQGFEIFTFNEEHVTARARFPKGLTTFAGRDVKGQTGDFVLARREGPYSDGRHPDWVEMGTLADDLSRRDFTVNAMARDADGKLIDLFGGRRDITLMRLKAVGSAEDRIREDALRALRAIRFEVTKGFNPDAELTVALNSEWLPPLLAKLSTERIYGELRKCFKFDTLKTLELLQSYDTIRDWDYESSSGLLATIFSRGLRLEPTLKG